MTDNGPEFGGNCSQNNQMTNPVKKDCSVKWE